MTSSVQCALKMKTTELEENSRARKVLQACSIINENYYEQLQLPFSVTAACLVLCGSGAFSRLTLSTVAVLSLVVMVSGPLVSSHRTASRALWGSNPHRKAAWLKTESGTASPSTARMWSRQEYSLATEDKTRGR